MSFSGPDLSNLDALMDDLEKIDQTLQDRRIVTPQIRQRMRLALAIDLLLRSGLSLTRAAEVAELPPHELVQELNDRGISPELYLGRTEPRVSIESWSETALKLSVVMPCYNERETLKTILERVRAVEIPKEIIIVDDCSGDGTRDILRNEIEGRYPDVKVLYHDRNQGKGAALRTGFAHATGTVILVQDADLEYNPQEYYRLLQPILDGHADVVYGSRFAGGSRRVHLYWHAVGNHVLTTLSNMFTNLNLTDMETCYKVFRREVLEGIEIRQNRFGFEPEITAKIAKRRARVYEIPISYHGRDYSEGKKIGWKDGLQALYCIVRYRFFD
jgi:predicted HTH domain antitoxin